MARCDGSKHRTLIIRSGVGSAPRPRRKIQTHSSEVLQECCYFNWTATLRVLRRDINLLRTDVEHGSVPHFPRAIQVISRRSAPFLHSELTLYTLTLTYTHSDSHVHTNTHTHTPTHTHSLTHTPHFSRAVPSSTGPS